MRGAKVYNVHSRSKPKSIVASKIVDIPRFREAGESQSLAQKYHGTCLDTRTINSMTKYDQAHDDFRKNWKCYFGHVFLDQFEAIEKRGYFCPTCKAQHDSIAMGRFKEYQLITEKDLIIVINLCHESRYTKIREELHGGAKKVVFFGGKEEFYFVDLGYFNCGGPVNIARSIFTNCPLEAAAHYIIPNDPKRAYSINTVMCKTNGHISIKDAVDKLFAQVFYPEITKKTTGDLNFFVDRGVRVGYTVRPRDTDHIEQTRDASGTIKIIVIALTNTLEKVIQLIIKYLKENDMSKIIDVSPDFITKCINFITGK